MWASVLALLTALLKAIPILERWLNKTPLEKEQGAKEDVDQEHSKNQKEKRPSGEFWDGRNP